jgi:hypothetical protein
VKKSNVQAKINALPIGQEFDVKTLMGSDWNGVRGKQSFGREFKESVRNGSLQNVRHVRLDNSPRRDVYIKI